MTDISQVVKIFLKSLSLIQNEEPRIKPEIKPDPPFVDATAEVKEDCYGIDRNEVKAFEWYKKAAENDTYSQYKLGFCFYEGLGTKKDIVKAIYWFNKAKENGDTDANELLGKK
ncbi:hypothetical protein Glove_308g35 [Diversispora epigaea]|uniref:HCP-like protein n=1 Tax=Diversispora epigaea TaxID=1348612 RepID=A0A397I0F5_9GLOM|nr:hypothetical protein Glove_308g35 [Diversispora epigaea]